MTRPAGARGEYDFVLTEVEPFGVRIHRLRVAQGLTVRGLAQLAGLTGLQVMNLEESGVTPTVRQLAALARALGVSMDYLWRGDDG